MVELYNPEQVTSIRVLENRTRPGYAIEGKAGNFDFKMINLHFKSTSRWDDTPEKRLRSFTLRQEQSEKLNDWIISELETSEKDLIILGDLNDNPKRNWSDNLKILKENRDINFITSSLESCKNPNWDNIDHILISKSVQARYVKGSAGMYNFNVIFSINEAKLVSDHCPVIATFNISDPDND